MSREFSQNIFYGLFVESIVAFLAWRIQDKKRLRFIVLAAGTVIAGGIAFGPQILAAINPPVELALTSTPSTLTNPITHIYDDFSNPANDGGVDRSRWVVSGDCNVSQNDGYLLIRHKPSSSDYASCSLTGPMEGVGGSALKLFEVKALASNDFEGICCSTIHLVLASNGFSGGGGYMLCGMDAGPGDIVGVFTINHKTNETEYRRQVETTYNDWHTLRFEINQTDYTVSCYIDNNLIGSVIPKDAEPLYESTFSRYIEAGWPKNTVGTFQIDDVKIIP